jgi:hypothetical protein
MIIDNASLSILDTTLGFSIFLRATIGSVVRLSRAELQLLQSQILESTESAYDEVFFSHVRRDCHFWLLSILSVDLHQKHLYFWFYGFKNSSTFKSY